MLNWMSSFIWDDRITPTSIFPFPPNISLNHVEVIKKLQDTSLVKEAMIQRTKLKKITPNERRGKFEPRSPVLQELLLKTKVVR
jgi:hypothetical protein